MVPMKEVVFVHRNRVDWLGGRWTGDVWCERVSVVQKAFYRFFYLALVGGATIVVVRCV